MRQDDDNAPRKRKRRKKDRRGGSTLTLLFLILAMILPTVSGFAGAALTMARRWVFHSGSECEFVRVLDGDLFRFHCFETGFGVAKLVGLEAPSTFTPECFAALRDGYQARWAFQLEVWRAREIQFVFEGVEDAHPRPVRLYLDGSEVAKTLLYQRFSQKDVFGREIDRCA